MKANNAGANKNAAVGTGTADSSVNVVPTAFSSAKSAVANLRSKSNALLLLIFYRLLRQNAGKGLSYLDLADEVLFAIEAGPPSSLREIYLVPAN